MPAQGGGVFLPGTSRGACLLPGGGLLLRHGCVRLRRDPAHPAEERACLPAGHRGPRETLTGDAIVRRGRGWRRRTAYGSCRGSQDNSRGHHGRVADIPGRCLVGPVGRTTKGAGGSMTTPSDPGLDAVMSERRQLINLAYRLLGSLAEAEDAVQETYARWYALTRPQQDAIENPAPG